jgi:hypothetical protein
MVGEGGVFSTCTVVSGSKNERVVTLANSPLGLRRRLVDEEFERVDAGGFGRSTLEMSWILLGRCNKRLLKPSTALGLLLFFGDEGRDCGESCREKLWSRSMLGMQRGAFVGSFSQSRGPNEEGDVSGERERRKKERERTGYKLGFDQRKKKKKKKRGRQVEGVRFAA